jgi:hypothetical protein
MGGVGEEAEPSDDELDAEQPAPSEEVDSGPQGQLWSGLVVALLFAGLGVLQIALLFGYPRQTGDTADVAASGSLHSIGRSALPDKIGYLEIVDYATQQTDEDGAGRSKIWTYRSEGHVVRISIDPPYPGWTEPADSYGVDGWEVSKGEVAQLDASRPDMQAVEMQLRKPTGERSLLIVGYLDNKGRPVAPPIDDWRSFVGRVRARLAKMPLLPRLLRPDVSDLSQPACQIRLFVRSKTELLNAEREQFRSVFRQVLSELRTSWGADGQRSDRDDRGTPVEDY